MNWIIYATTAAFLWGIGYALSEQLMRQISIASLMLAGAFANLAFALVLGLSTGGFVQDWPLLKKGGTPLKLLVASTLVYVSASIFILLSTKAKNATMAAMVEITYPLFTALFAWLWFHEMQVNTGIFCGMALIMVGVGCIYYFSKTI